MSIASVSYNTSGSVGPYTVPYPYLEETDIKVYLDGVLQTLTTHYTFSSATSITLVSAPGASAVIRITRDTQDEPYVDFTDPAPIQESDLDTATLQALYAAQEAKDDAGDSLQLDATKTFYDAGSKLIKNVATPTGAAHAVTKAYVDAIAAAAGNVPTPDDPADDDKVLTASGGLFDWVAASGGLFANTTNNVALVETFHLLDLLANDADKFFQARKSGVRTWTAKYAAPARYGSNKAFIVTNDGSPDLELALVDVTGGQRLYVWDTATVMPNIPHTAIPPTFAVMGDILVGDIVALESNPMTYFIRDKLGLAETATTQLFSARAINADTDGGAGIVMAPALNAGGAVSDGYIRLIAFGKGSGGNANEIRLANRTAANTVTDQWTLGAQGVWYPSRGDALNDIGVTTGNRVKTVHAKQFSGSGGTGTARGFAPVILEQNTAAGTGCPADMVENDLKTYTVPANTLATDGDALRITMTFRCAANATTKRIQIYYGGTQLLDSSIIALNDQRIWVELNLTRTGASAQFAFARIMSQATHNDWSQALKGDVYNPANPAKDNTAAQILKATITLGAGAALNDVIQDMLIVEYIRKSA